MKIKYELIPSKEVTIMGFAGGMYNNNGFILLVVIFVLLVIVGNNYPTGGDID
jgi:uncharacterized protein (TIGR01732 family)